MPKDGRKRYGHKNKKPEFKSSHRHDATSYGCPSGKLGWDDKAKAKLALRRKQSASSENTVCRIYRCRDCGKWHLTSQRPR